MLPNMKYNNSNEFHIQIKRKQEPIIKYPFRMAQEYNKRKNNSVFIQSSISKYPTFNDALYCNFNKVSYTYDMCVHTYTLCVGTQTMYIAHVHDKIYLPIAWRYLIVLKSSGGS